MIVAREKRKKNIAEYVLYMWQVEDTLRAMKFDMNLVEEKLIKQFKQSDLIIEGIRDWYANLILSMHEEGIMKSGHLNMVKAVISDMYDLHKRLITTHIDSQYFEKYKEAKPNIEAFHEKLKMDGINEIEVCFYGLYGLLLLRLKKKEITNETQKAMQTFSELLAKLSVHFLDFEQGRTEF